MKKKIVYSRKLSYARFNRFASTVTAELNSEVTNTFYFILFWINSYSHGKAFCFGATFIQLNYIRHVKPSRATVKPARHGSYTTFERSLTLDKVGSEIIR